VPDDCNPTRLIPALIKYHSQLLKKIFPHRPAYSNAE